MQAVVSRILRRVFCAPGVARYQAGRAKEPAAHLGAGTEIAGLAGQQHEYRLDDILSQVRIAHVAEGHGVNPVEVEPDQFGERRFGAVLGVSLKQLPVIHAGADCHSTINARQSEKGTLGAREIEYRTSTLLGAIRIPAPNPVREPNRCNLEPLNSETPRIIPYLVLAQRRLTLQAVYFRLAHFQLPLRLPKSPSPPTRENPRLPPRVACG